MLESVTVGVTITLAALIAGCSPAEEDRGIPLTAGSGAPVVLPGGPGEPGRTATPGEHLGESDSRATAADVVFAEAMIPHHRQALEMAALVPDRTTNPRIRAIAERIAASQEPEIRVMTTWLTGLGRTPPDGHDHMGGRYGMATLEQMNQLRAARGEEFDRLFLTLMIAHHEGAVVMAKEEIAKGTDRTMRFMARDIAAGQSVEINRMKRLLDG